MHLVHVFVHSGNASNPHTICLSMIAVIESNRLVALSMVLAVSGRSILTMAALPIIITSSVGVVALPFPVAGSSCSRVVLPFLPIIRDKVSLDSGSALLDFLFLSLLTPNLCHRHPAQLPHPSVSIRLKVQSSHNLPT